MRRLLARLFAPRRAPLATLPARLGRRVTARGRVVPRDLIASPLTGAQCVYYRHVVEEWRDASVALPVRTGIWLCVAQDEAIAEFYIDDGSGRALILPEGADVVAAPAGPPIEMPLGQRASEQVIVAGDLVEVRGVAGEVEDLLDENRGYREPAARALLRAPEGARLKIRRL